MTPQEKSEYMDKYKVKTRLCKYCGEPMAIEKTKPKYHKECLKEKKKRNMNKSLLPSDYVYGQFNLRYS